MSARLSCCCIFRPSHFPGDSMWFFVRCFSLKNLQNRLKISLTNWGPFPISRIFCILYDLTHLSAGTFATCLAVVFDEYIAFVIFDYRYFIYNINTFSNFVRTSGTKMSIGIKGSRRNAATRSNFRFRSNRLRLRAHVQQLLTVWLSSFGMCGQKNAFCIESHTHSSLGCRAIHG